MVKLLQKCSVLARQIWFKNKHIAIFVLHEYVKAEICF